ncbi:A49-like RNA polymerase I associated factor-domain-containing protein [Aspergillus pseudodeflectus]|uniref:A49-like RNA polymerase I associated factor-domain-containing protein n=1 Tax=Aspergillus pseudodeflectus TaxID=176178 RepID=A0ABR4KQZ9_9EURO
MASDKAEKKRKRASNGHERPTKKPALDLRSLPPLKANLIKDHSELTPVLITTPGVTSQPNIQLTPYLKPRSEVSTSSGNNKGIASTELLLQSSQHSKLDFVGREANDDADSQLKHYVAVVDPANQSWEFVEVRKVTLRGAVRKAAAGDEEVEESEDEEMRTMREQKTDLTYTFGTKKSRKATQSMAENAQLSNAPSGAATAAESALLDSMPAEVAADLAAKAAAVQAEVQAAKPIPQADLTAKHPSEVYPIETLIPNGRATLRALPIKDWQDTISAGLMVATTSRFVSNRVDAIVESGNTTQLQILRFILVLLELYRSLRRGGKQSANSGGPGSRRLPSREDLPGILSGGTRLTSTSSDDVDPSIASSTLSAPTVDAIRRKFAPNRTYLSKNDVTFLETTICALSLHIPPQPVRDGVPTPNGGNSPNEMATDPSDLRDDLQLENNEILHYFRELGCRVDKPRETEFEKWNVRGGKSEAATRRIARLRIPVEFPKVSRGGRR